MASSSSLFRSSPSSLLLTNRLVDDLEWLLNTTTTGRLELSSLQLDAPLIQALVDKLEQRTKANTKPTVTALNLATNLIDDQALVIIGTFLEHDDTIEILNLDNNQYSEKGLEVFFDLVASNKTLKSLKIGRWFRANMSPNRFSHVIGSYLGDDPALLELTIGPGLIDDNEFIFIVEGLANNTNLQKLAIANQFIDDKLHLVADIATDSTSLKYLDISRNEIEPSQVPPIFAALSQGSSLTHLAMVPPNSTWGLYLADSCPPSAYTMAQTRTAVIGNTHCVFQNIKRKHRPSA